MSHFKHKHKMRRFIAVLLSVSAAIVGSVTIATPAYANDDDDRKATIANSDYEPGDLYSSLIFSLSGDVESADGVEMSFSQICKYPAAESVDKTQTYGRLLEPQSNAQCGVGRAAAGGQLVSYFRTLYDYGWFEPLPKAEDNILSWAFQVVIDWASDTIGSSSARASLASAMVGAMLYDFSTSMIALGEKIAIGVNIPQLFGLVEDDGSSSFLNDLFAWTFLKIGVNQESVSVLSKMMIILFTFAFTFILIKTLKKNKSVKSEHTSNFKKFGSRILVMVLTVPMAVMTSAVVNLVAAPEEALNELASELNGNYIVDTLDWAVYGNMSLGWVNPHGLLNTDGSSDVQFKPTRENVDNLNANIQAAKIAMGHATTHNSSAMGLLEEYASGQTASVQDYFAGLSNLPTLNKTLGDTSEGRSARNSVNTNNFASGYEDDVDKYETYPGGEVFFFSPKTKGSSDASSEASDEAKRGVDILVGSQGAKFNLSDSSPVTAKRVALNNPQSYLYGSIPPENLSDATKKFANYIGDTSRSQQLINPETGEKIDGSDDSKEAKAIRTNALRIAVINRYSGMRDKSLSDQSTAFFLQTKRVSESSINYKGYNTAANEAGESKNTGKYGNAFIRYTMPAEGVVDYYGRIGSLTSVWVMSGLLGFVSLFILMKAPVFSSMMRSLKGFVSSLLTGNITGFLEYLIWFAALRVSFLFATVGIHFGVAMDRYFIADNSVIYTITGGLFGAAGLVGSVPVVGTAAGAGMSLTALLPLVILSLLLVAVVCWPAIKVQYSNGRIRRVSVIGALIMLPFLVAEQLSESLDGLHRNMYGKSRTSGGKSKGLLGGRIGERLTKKSKAEQNRANIDKKRQELLDKRESSKDFAKAEENKINLQHRQGLIDDKIKSSKEHVKAQINKQDLAAREGSIKDRLDSKKKSVKAEKKNQDQRAKQEEAQTDETINSRTKQDVNSNTDSAQSVSPYTKRDQPAENAKKAQSSRDEMRDRSTDRKRDTLDAQQSSDEQAKPVNKNQSIEENRFDDRTRNSQAGSRDDNDSLDVKNDRRRRLNLEATDEEKPRKTRKELREERRRINTEILQTERTPDREVAIDDRPQNAEREIQSKIETEKIIEKTDQQKPERVVEKSSDQLHSEHIREKETIREIPIEKETIIENNTHTIENNTHTIENNTHTIENNTHTIENQSPEKVIEREIIREAPAESTSSNSRFEDLTQRRSRGSQEENNLNKN